MRSITKVFATGAGVAAASYASYVAATWLRYGRTKPAKGEDRDELLDAVMPDYEVVDRHAIHVAAPAEVTFSAAKTVELSDSRIVRGIFKARELILRSKADGSTRPRGMIEGMKAIGWGVLAESPTEIVLGAVTKPWESNPVFRTLTPTEFPGFKEPDYVKIVWTLRADPDPNGGSTFRSETRALATDPGARRKFRAYWAFLSPGIILIRNVMMPAVKAIAERAWPMEGDDLLPDARTQLTHSILIAAPPSDVWPWIVQMGCQRGGWYSYDRLDNGGVASAERIIPELQKVALGDIFPYRPGGTEGFDVARIVPGRALVLHSKGPQFEGTWAFVLEPVGKKTRLVTRYRASYPPSPRMAVTLPVMAQVHAFMEKKQLRTIKHHAEHMHLS